MLAASSRDSFSVSSGKRAGRECSSLPRRRRSGETERNAAALSDRQIGVLRACRIELGARLERTLSGLPSGACVTLVVWSTGDVGRKFHSVVGWNVM